MIQESQMANVKSQSYRLNVKSNIRYRAYEFSKCIIALIKDLPDSQNYWCFRDQLMKSATSIGANIIEAKSASSRREFIKYYEIALKSANETKYWLCLLRDTKLCDNREQLNKILQEAVEIANMIGAALITLKGRNFLKTS